MSQSWEVPGVSGKSLGSLWEVFQLNFLALVSLKSVWEVSGRSREVSWRSLKGLWEVSGRSLGGLLGGRASRRLQNVLDSKSDASVSENAQKFTLPKIPKAAQKYQTILKAQKLPKNQTVGDSHVI